MKNLLLLLSILFAFEIICSAQGARFESTATTVIRVGSTKNLQVVLPGAQVVVCQYQACPAPATLCTDITCGASASSNVVTADSVGNFGFFALPGNYTYQISASGATAGTFTASIGTVIDSHTFSGLPAEHDGTIFYCTDCQQATTCIAGGTGAFAQGIAGSWNCSGGGGGGQGGIVANPTGGLQITGGAISIALDCTIGQVKQRSSNGWACANVGNLVGSGTISQIPFYSSGTNLSSSSHIRVTTDVNGKGYLNLGATGGNNPFSGTAIFFGANSGSVKVHAHDVANGDIYWPNAAFGGTLVATAKLPLIIDSDSGEASCPQCVSIYQRTVFAQSGTADFLEPNSMTTFHVLSWTTSGAVSSCSVAIDSSSDNSLWSAGGLMTAQDCHANGSAQVTGSADYIRVNVGALSGGGSVTMTYRGYTAGLSPPAFSFALPQPGVADSGKYHHKLPINATVSRISCSTDQGTASVTLDVRPEANPNTDTNTHVLTSPLTCTTSTGVATSFDNPSYTAYQVIALDITATSGSPTALNVHVTMQPQ